MIRPFDDPSDADLERLVEREQPAWFPPMLATLTHEPFSDPAWIWRA